jgi:hypothetical protein
VNDALVVRAMEDASGKFATLQVDHIDPIGLPSAPNWVNVAQLDGAHAGDTVNVLIDNIPCTWRRFMSTYWCSFELKSDWVNVRSGSNSEVAGLGQHVRSTLRTALGRRAACPPCVQRFIAGMNQLLVPVLSLLQL